MTRVIFLAVLAFLSVGHVFGQCGPDGMGCSPDQVDAMIQMDMEAAAVKAKVDPSSKVDKTETLAPRQFLVGGYGGYGGFGGYGGYALGGYGGYGGYGLGYGGGLSSGLCTRTCLGIGCRMICRNRVFFDEDPEESQDSTDSDDELTEDEMNDLSPMDDESDDTQDDQDDSMVASTKEDWHAKNPEKTLRSGSCSNPSHGHSKSERHRLEILESSRPSIPSSKWSREKHYREITESAKPEVSSNWNTEHRFNEQRFNEQRESSQPEVSSNWKEIHEIRNSGKKLIVVPHEIFKTLKPTDILVRKNYITNPDGSKTWTSFKTISETSQTGSSNENVLPSVINNNKISSESTIANSGSLENSNTAWEKHHSSKEESSRGNFFNPSSTMLDRFSSERTREIQPSSSSSLRESSLTETSSSRQEELERQELRREEMERREEQRFQEERREEMRRRKEEQRLRNESQRNEVNWSSGSSSRRVGLEFSNLESGQLPSVNSGEGMLMTKKQWKMMMKKKHHKNRPVIIIMDEDQLQQPDM